MQIIPKAQTASCTKCHWRHDINLGFQCEKCGGQMEEYRIPKAELYVDPQKKAELESLYKERQEWDLHQLKKEEREYKIKASNVGLYEWSTGKWTERKEEPPKPKTIEERLVSLELAFKRMKDIPTISPYLRCYDER